MSSHQQDDDSPDRMEDESTGASRLRGELDQVKRVATGGMAHIFRARQPSLDRFIAVKKLREEMVVQPELLERFRREAKALASVLHQNVAHVYDFVESGRESYILMEYIEGVDVSEVIDKVGQIPSDVAACILLCVARGVNYIHNHHLIHRDIKPSNIRLTTRGEVKLMDFGIVMDIQNSGLTRPGMMVGSPSYLSPEQILGDNISTKADIFLMGICLYEMVTGTRPFKDEGKVSIFQRIREAKYVPAREMNKTVPAQLDRIIRQCLKKDPEKRFANVRAMITELENFLCPSKSSHTEDIILKFLDGEALLTPTIPVVEIQDESAMQKRIRMGMWIVFFFMGVFLFGLGYYLGHQDKMSPTSLWREFPPPHALRK